MKKKRKNPLKPIFLRSTFDELESIEDVINYIRKNYSYSLGNNQYLELLLYYIHNKSLPIKYIGSGGTRDVFYFYTDVKLYLGRYEIPQGTYVLKLSGMYGGNKIQDKFFEEFNSEAEKRYAECIRMHRILSKLDIIPRVYFIDNHFMIMKYIDGIPMNDLWIYIQNNSLHYTQADKLKSQQKKLIEVIGKFIKTPFDQYEGNFIITKDFRKVYYIDPC